MVPLAFAFIFSLRAKNQSKDERLPSLPAKERIVVIEAIRQDLMQDQHLLFAKAEPIAELMLKGYID